jgi:hypothetical protein
MSFKRLDPEDFTFNASNVVGPAWSTNTSSLTSFYTSSFQSPDSTKYYSDVYASNPNVLPPSIDGYPLSKGNEIQFSIAYGNADGLGSLWYNSATPGQSPSRTVYGQFVNLLLGENEGASFNFGEGKSSRSDFFVITINRANYKQSIMPGSLKIRGIINPNFTLINPASFITDNSLIVSSSDYTPAGRRYNLGASVSQGRGIPYQGSIEFGYLYPDIGVIILNPSAVRSVFSVASNIDSNNPASLVPYFTEFNLLSEETVTSNYIFCRAQNHEFNFSTQNNFISSTRNITGSSGATNNDFIETPSTYITSVGLYNDNNELLAVAKLSKPLKKDFTTEALIRVKLDF